jgi:hypothetical protein
MSLLDTASLILTPNAYKEGTLYSVIPSDGSGDMSVVRATSATRVNSEGLIEVVSLLGNELVTNGDFATDSDWTKQTGWSISNGVANYDFTSDVKYIRQTLLNGGFVSGKTYRINFEITTGTAYMYINSNGGGLISLNTYSVGSYSLYTTASVNGSDLLIYGRNTGGTAFSIDNVSVKEVITLNIPRLDYSLGGCPNILLEPQRTNLATYSEQFDNADWSKINSSITANADISPDGYTNADRIYDDAASGQHRVGKNISVVSATTYTFSVFAKKGSLRYCYLLTTAGGASDRYYFDLQDGVSITAGGKIEDYGSGWYRISAQVTAAATGNELFAFNLTNSSSSPNYLGTGTGYHMIYGYQVEAGNYQTSYIPTTSASVTRNQDVCDKTSATALIGQTEGTVLIDIDLKLNNRNQTLWSLSDGASTSNFILVYHTDVNTLSARIRTVGVDQINITTATLPQGRYKLAMAYKENDVAFYVNGSLIGTDNSCAVPSPLNKISLTQIGTAVNIREGFTKGFALWKERLTNDQLAQLTTI